MIAALPLVSSAIGSVLGSLGPTAGAAQSAASTAGADSFTSVLASLSKDTVDKLKTSESVSIAGLQGKATVQSVVQSVMDAQESLQTALAVRDKAVAAFQDVTRMAI